ncbi:MAG: carbamate kinase [Thermoplasmata archaeon]
MDRIVVAVGGNALQLPGDAGKYEEMVKRAEETAESIYFLFNEYDVALTHGNGPQVGAILLQNEHSKEIVPPMPLDVLGAESQGMIGYILTQGFERAFNKYKINKKIVTVVTRVEVDENDPAMKNPTKPIGPFYTRVQAEELIREKHWNMVEDSGRGWRRVVPSPDPKRIVEKDEILSLIERGYAVISVGGGGIPVVKRNGFYYGIEGVIDKDLGAATLAKDINASELFILTAVPQVYINFGKPEQTPIEKINADELEKYYKEGHFKPGSMGPKVLAAIRFVRNGGKRALITSPDALRDALNGKNGTWIYP